MIDKTQLFMNWNIEINTHSSILHQSVLFLQRKPKHNRYLMLLDKIILLKIVFKKVVKALDCYHLILMDQKY
jgi:hypothetical protein